DLQIEQTARLRQIGQFGVSWMEGQGNKGLKTAGLVLQLSQPAEVVDAVSSVLDVAVKHGGIGTQAECVCLAVDADPGVGIRFVFANPVANLGMKDLGPAARQTAETRRLEFRKDIARGPAGEARKPVPFDSRVSLQVQPWVSLMDDADDVQI